MFSNKHFQGRLLDMLALGSVFYTTVLLVQALL